MADNLEIEYGFDYADKVVNVVLPLKTEDGKAVIKQFSLERWLPHWTAGEGVQCSGSPFVAGCPAWYDQTPDHINKKDFWESLDAMTYGRGNTRQEAFEDLVARCIYAQVSAANLFREVVGTPSLEDPND